jgi:hypothetical protein
MTADGVDIPLGVKNCLVHFKNREPTDEELENLTPIILTQGEVPWNPKDDEHNSPVDNSFAEEVQNAAKADTEAAIEEQFRSFNSNVHIYNTIVESASNEFDSKDDCTGMTGNDQVTPEQGGLSNLEESTDSTCSQQE